VQTISLMMSMLIRKIWITSLTAISIVIDKLCFNKVEVHFHPFVVVIVVVVVGSQTFPNAQSTNQASVMTTLTT